MTTKEADSTATLKDATWPTSKKVKLSQKLEWAWLEMTKDHVDHSRIKDLYRFGVEARALEKALESTDSDARLKALREKVEAMTFLGYLDKPIIIRGQVVVSKKEVLAEIDAATSKPTEAGATKK